MRYLACVLSLVSLIAQAEVSSSSAALSPDNWEMLNAAAKVAFVSYNSFVKQELGIDQQYSVHVDIAASNASYSAMLPAYGVSNVAQASLWTSSYILPDRHKILIKTLPPYDMDAFNERIWIGMTSMVEIDLAGKNIRKVAPWVKQGTADFVAALVAQKAGSQSVETWKFQSIDVLRHANDYPMPRDFANFDDSDWAEATRNTKGAVCRVADLMMTYLHDQRGAGLFAELPAYFRCMKDPAHEDSCFAKNFGIEQEQFVRQARACK
ncbi:MAG: hypothetical protein ACHP7O_08290 [Burkholderiales bacterium]